MSIQSTLQELRTIDLSEIRLDNIGRWPLIVRILACILTFIAVLVIVFFWKIRVINEELVIAERQETSLRQEFSRKAYEVANLKDYQLQKIELDERLAVLVGQLPSKTEVPGLLEDVTEIGSSSGLQIQAIELQDEVTRDYYVELPIQIEAIGEYHDFATFVSGVSGLSRIVTQHDFTIENDDSGLLSLSILARTYRYKESTEEEGVTGAQ